MYIQLTTITQANQQRNFNLHADELELAFNLIASLTKQGETVANVSYFDHKGELPLPLEAIRSPFSINPFRQLKQQWESILATAAKLDKVKLSRQSEHLVTIRQNRLSHLQQVQKQMQQLVETTQISLSDGPRKKRLLALHQQTIQRCQQSIAQLDALL